MFIYFLSFLLLQNSALPLIRLADIDRAKIDDGTTQYGPHIPVMNNEPNIIVADSSVNQYTMWLQIQECLGYNPIRQGLQFVCRSFAGGGLDVWQTNYDFTHFVTDVLNTPSRYPNSVASDDGSGNGPHISFTFLIGGAWGGMGAQYERGGWFSSIWDPPVDVGTGNLGTIRNIGKQLPNGNMLFIAPTNNAIRWSTYSPDLSVRLAGGVVAPAIAYYWGFDINAGIAYLFYYDNNLNLYYKTTTDGINWSPAQVYNIIWPQPYDTNIVGLTQMAVTDAGNPILVFTIGDGSGSYPGGSKVYVSIGSGIPCIEVGNTAIDAKNHYPTIATGGNYVVILFGQPRSEAGLYTFWDIYYNYSVDNGLSWHTPRNLTGNITNHNNCLWQIAKRLDARGAGQFFFVFGCDITDPLRDLYALVMNNVPVPSRWYVGRHPVVGIAENKTERPKRVILEVSTNPVIAQVVISYTIPFASNVLLRLFSVDGRLIKTIDKGHRPGGKYNHRVDTSGLSSGIYILNLETDHGNATEKIILIH